MNKFNGTRNQPISTAVTADTLTYIIFVNRLVCSGFRYPLISGLFTAIASLANNYDCSDSVQRSSFLCDNDAQLM